MLRNIIQAPDHTIELSTKKFKKISGPFGCRAVCHADGLPSTGEGYLEIEKGKKKKKKNIQSRFFLVRSVYLGDDHNRHILPDLERQGLRHTGSQSTHPRFGTSGSATQC